MASIGIDFGAAHTRAAFVRGRWPEVVYFDNGASFIPSTAVVTGGRVRIGVSNHELSPPEASATIRGVKRLIGRNVDDSVFARAVRTNTAPIVASGGSVRIQLPTHALDPHDIAAAILGRAIEQATIVHGEAPTTAVLSLPGWLQPHAPALEKVARSAGLLHVELIPDPIAAALALGVTRERLVAVVDLGASAASVSILRTGPLGVVLLSCASDVASGGDDIDRAMAAWAIDGLHGRFGELSRDARTDEAIRLQCERAKRELASRDAVVVPVPFVSPTLGMQHQHVRFRRDRFESLLRPIVGRFEALARVALGDAGVDADRLQCVFAVGGMSGEPVLRDAIGRALGRIAPFPTLATDAVVLGAAIRAGVIDGRFDGVPLVDTRQSIPMDIVPSVPDLKHQCQAPEDPDDELEVFETRAEMFEAARRAEQENREEPSDVPPISAGRPSAFPATNRDPQVDRAAACCRLLVTMHQVPERSLRLLNRELGSIDHDGFMRQAVAYAAATSSTALQQALIDYVEEHLPRHERLVGELIPKVSADQALRLIGVLSQTKSAKALDSLAPALRSPHLIVRLQALSCLAASSRRVGWADLAPLLTDPDPDIRRQVLEMVAAHRYPDAGLALSRRIRDGGFDRLAALERMLLLEALASVNVRRAEKMAIEILDRTRLFSSSRDDSRAIAAEFLSRSDSEDALVALERHARRRFANSASVRESAARAAQVVRRRSSRPPDSARNAPSADRA